MSTEVVEIVHVEYEHEAAQTKECTSPSVYISSGLSLPVHTLLVILCHVPRCD